MGDEHISHSHSSGSPRITVCVLTASKRAKARLFVASCDHLWQIANIVYKMDKGQWTHCSFWRGLTWWTWVIRTIGTSGDESDNMRYKEANHPYGPQVITWDMKKALHWRANLTEGSTMMVMMIVMMVVMVMMLLVMMVLMGLKWLHEIWRPHLTDLILAARLI